MGVMRDMPLQKYIHDALICLHSGDGNADARLRIAEALGQSPARPLDARRGIGIDVIMDFSLNNEQRAWQMTARKFAEEEIKPISLERDETPDAHGTFDWDIIEKGSKLGFRTLAVPKEYGGEGTDFVTQALVMAELARGDSAISQDLQPELEVEPPDRAGLQRRAEGALPEAVRRRPPLPARQGHHRAERRLRQPPAAGGRPQGRA